MESGKGRKVDADLRESETWYRRLFETAKDGVLLLNEENGRITDVNPYLLEILGYSKAEIIGKQVWEFVAKKDRKRNREDFYVLRQKEFLHFDDLPMRTKDGRLIEFEVNSNVYLVNDGKVIQYNLRDITERKRAERVLRETEEKLVQQNLLLERKNVALSEIMIQIREERSRLESQVQANVENLVMPVLKKLMAEGGPVAVRYAAIIEANLNEITSGFGNTISSRMLGLTQKEIDVCNMIRNGLGSKQISDSLGIATRTVETHRNNIRKKFGIAGKNVNLAAYLKYMK